MGVGVKGSRPGRTGATVKPRGDIGGLPEGSSYSPGVIDARMSVHGEEPYPTRGDPVYTKHGESKGVNLEKQSPILRCECHACGMNGSG
jgi:hypothetical protein